MESASSLLARSINHYMSFLRSIGPSCMELNLSLTNSSFCDFPLMEGFLFKKYLQKAGEDLLIKKIALTFAKQKRGISSSG